MATRRTVAPVAGATSRAPARPKPSSSRRAVSSSTSVPGSTPEGATWEGKGEAGVLFDSGTEYSHTFETLGTYEYVCTPHESVGMVGSIEVVEEISTPEPAQGPPEIPDPAKVLGLAGTIGIGATLGLGYFLMRFGGGYDEE